MIYVQERGDLCNSLCQTYLTLKDNYYFEYINLVPNYALTNPHLLGVHRYKVYAYLSTQKILLNTSNSSVRHNYSDTFTEYW